MRKQSQANHEVKEEVVPASKCRVLQNLVTELRRLLGKKKMEVRNSQGSA